MQEKIIKRNIIIAISVTVFLLIVMVVAWGQLLVKPQNAAIAAAELKYQDRKKVADALPTALTEKRKAEDQRQYLEGQLAFFRSRYRSLYFGAINDTNPAIQEAAREVAWRRWMNEYHVGYGIALKRELEAAANATGVTISSAIKVSAPPRAPEEVAPTSNGLFRPTSSPMSMTIVGTLPAILQFFNRINQSSILMVVDRNLKLEGYSPEIKATFSLTPYLLAAGPGAKLGGTGAAAPAGGAPATPGMSPEGMPPSDSAAPSASPVSP
jgi:hypothetical protein